MLLVFSALLLTPSCDQNSDEAILPETVVKPEEPFVLVQRLVNNDGAFELLTLIEGAEANQQFKKNLDIVRGQRIALKKLSKQIDKTDEVKQKTEVIEKKLQENTDLMAKIYGYNTSSIYIFIPIHSALIKVVDGKEELIKTIESPKQHHRLQGMRGKYAGLIKKDGEISAEAQTLAATLMQDFSYDVKSKYKIEVSKGALYRKVN